jgi:hypothetical protein
VPVLAKLKTAPPFSYKRCDGSRKYSFCEVAEVGEQQTHHKLFLVLSRFPTERHSHELRNIARLHLLHDCGSMMLGRPRADP